MIRTQIQLYPEQVKWLKKFGHEKGISMSEVIRNSIDAYREYAERTRDLYFRKEKALSAVGTFASHDES